MQGITKTIRELDPELYRLARSQALKEGKAIGAWLNEAIREKLDKLTATKDREPFDPNRPLRGPGSKDWEKGHREPKFDPKKPLR